MVTELINTSRIRIEQAILGACILDNGAYIRIADVLIENNFSVHPSGYDHKLVYRALKDMFPMQHIDLLTVSHRVGKFPSYLAELTSMVSSSCNILTHAYLLLQIDIRDKFVQLLLRYNSEIEKDSIKVSLSTKLALMEIIDECLDTRDIIDIVGRAENYLEGIGAEDYVLDAVGGFYKKFQVRLQKISRRSTVDSLFSNLDSIGLQTFDITTKNALNHLADLTKYILAKGKADESLASAIAAVRPIL